MEAEKVRNLSDAELAQQQRDQMDQLFRLKFQMKMGQTESLNKIRGLRRGLARMKTIARERALGISEPVAGTAKHAKSEGKAEHKTTHAAKTAHATKTAHAAKPAAAKSKAQAKGKAAKKKSVAAAKKSKAQKKSGKR
jgi:large subunit ribosomal protein L29